MATDWVQTVTWGPITNSGELQNNYFRIPFAGAPHIVGSAYLAELSLGGNDGVSGIAVATFKRCEFLDDGGLLQVREFTSLSSLIEVVRCVSITIALDLTDAVAMGGWTFYWMS
jgi:hypothetical protein